jgi:hypothetical protein
MTERELHNYMLQLSHPKGKYPFHNVSTTKIVLVNTPHCGT